MTCTCPCAWLCIASRAEVAEQAEAARAVLRAHLRRHRRHLRDRRPTSRARPAAGARAAPRAASPAPSSAGCGTRHVVVLVQDRGRLAVRDDLAEDAVVTTSRDTIGAAASFAPAARARFRARGAHAYTPRMADVRPFRGLRFDAARVDPALTIAPPYDVISRRRAARAVRAQPAQHRARRVRRAARRRHAVRQPLHARRRAISQRGARPAC